MTLTKIYWIIWSLSQIECVCERERRYSKEDGLLLWKYLSPDTHTHTPREDCFLSSSLRCCFILLVRRLLILCQLTSYEAVFFYIFFVCDQICILLSFFFAIPCVRENNSCCFILSNYVTEKENRVWVSCYINLMTLQRFAAPTLSIYKTMFFVLFCSAVFSRYTIFVAQNAFPILVLSFISDCTTGVIKYGVKISHGISFSAVIFFSLSVLLCVPQFQCLSPIYLNWK